MTSSTTTAARNRVEFSVDEATGAIGDSITVLPVVVALGATTDVSLAHVFLFFGAFQVVWGLAYGLPLSVEPMKALAGLAIAGVLTYGELVAAGFVAGVTLLVLGLTGTLGRVRAVVGDPVVRGIQIGVALVLARTGLELGVADPVVAGAGVVVAGVVAFAGLRQGSALVLLALGFAAAVAATGVPTPEVPATGFSLGDVAVFSRGALSAAFAQVAMTVGNAAVATSLLLSDRFDVDVSPDHLAINMGTMTIAAVPLGGIPMCHGSGGLAGKCAFGARTGGANVLLGLGYLALALVVGGGFLAAFPMSLLGVLLVLVALSLARTGIAGCDSRGDLALAGTVGVLGLAGGIGMAFIAGVALSLLRSRVGSA